jgi:hypothetical protein
MKVVPPALVTGLDYDDEAAPDQRDGTAASMARTCTSSRPW